MGQAPSSEPPKLDHRIDDPPALPPKGLALIAHGRLGGTIDCPIVRALATCLRERHGCRVVTWSARGIANSGGVNEWGDLGVWVGDKSREDYSVSPVANKYTHRTSNMGLNDRFCLYVLQRMLKIAMEGFARDFPNARGRRLFICVRQNIYEQYCIVIVIDLLCRDIPLVPCTRAQFDHRHRLISTARRDIY